MDHKQFDELVARIASAASRREAVKGLVGSALAAAGLASALDAADVQAKGKKKGGKKTKGSSKKKGAAKKDNKGKGGGGVDADVCLANNARCDPPQKRIRRGKGKKKGKKPFKNLGCDRCCSGVSKPVTGPGQARRRCACIDTSFPCTDTKQCCSGVCAGGICQSFS